MSTVDRLWALQELGGDKEHKEGDEGGLCTGEAQEDQRQEQAVPCCMW
jgi:hypothetical protein